MQGTEEKFTTDIERKSAAEMQRFFIFCEKMYDLGRFGTIWNDFVRFGTIWYDGYGIVIVAVEPSDYEERTSDRQVG